MFIQRGRIVGLLGLVAFTSALKIVKEGEFDCFFPSCSTPPLNQAKNILVGLNEKSKVG